MPSAERRLQLLQTARAIISREGVGALTMSALAEAVGVGKPIVYKHFRNSEDVAIEILTQYARGSVEAASSRVQGAKTVYDFMDRLIDSLFDYIRAEGSVIRSITNGFSSSENVDRCFLSMQNRSLRVYRHLLTQQGVPDSKASLAAYALMEMINSTIMEFAPRSTSEDQETLKQIVRATLQALIGGEGITPHVPFSVLDPVE